MPALRSPVLEASNTRKPRRHTPYKTPKNASEKKSHAKKQEEGHIPRPLNAFMLFRSHICRSGSLQDGSKQEQVKSKTIGEMWKQLSEAEKSIWKAAQEQARIEHEAKYPNYTYQPRPRKNQKGSKKKKKDESCEAEDEVDEEPATTIQEERENEEPAETDQGMSQRIVFPSHETREASIPYSIMTTDTDIEATEEAPNINHITHPPLTLRIVGLSNPSEVSSNGDVSRSELPVVLSNLGKRKMSSRGITRSSTLPSTLPSGSEAFLSEAQSPSPHPPHLLRTITLPTLPRLNLETNNDQTDMSLPPLSTMVDYSLTQDYRTIDPTTINPAALTHYSQDTFYSNYDSNFYPSFHIPDTSSYAFTQPYNNESQETDIEDTGPYAFVRLPEPSQESSLPRPPRPSSLFLNRTLPIPKATMNWDKLPTDFLENPKYNVPSQTITHFAIGPPIKMPINQAKAKAKSTSTSESISESVSKFKSESKSKSKSKSKSTSTSKAKAKVKAKS